MSSTTPGHIPPYSANNDEMQLKGCPELSWAFFEVRGAWLGVVLDSTMPKAGGGPVHTSTGDDMDL